MSSQHSHVRRRPRRAFSLTELTVAMVAGSALMLLAVGTVHHAMTWSSIAKQRIEDDQSFDRLQRQFRHDVHLATASTMDDSTGISLSLSNNNTVTYKVVEGAVQRIESSGESGEQDDSRESYSLSESLIVTWEQRDDPKQILLSVKRKSPQSLTRKTDSKADSPMPYWRRVEAVQGRMARLQSTNYSTKTQLESASPTSEVDE